MDEFLAVDYISSLKTAYDEVQAEVEDLRRKTQSMERAAGTPHSSQQHHSHSHHHQGHRQQDQQHIVPSQGPRGGPHEELEGMSPTSPGGHHGGMMY